MEPVNANTNTTSNNLESIPSTTTQNPPKSGIVFRWAAYTIDSVIVSVISLIFFGLLNMGLGTEINQGQFSGLLLIIYSIIGTGVYGTSIGKKFFNLYVINSLGTKPSFVRAVLRESIGKILSGIPLGLGYAWAIWDKDKQTWHDKIGGTYVVQTAPVGGGKKAFAYFVLFVLPALAIIGILATIVLVAINPQAQLQKAKETQLKQQQIIQQQIMEQSQTPGVELDSN